MIPQLTVFAHTVHSERLTCWCIVLVTTNETSHASRNSRIYATSPPGTSQLCSRASPSKVVGSPESTWTLLFVDLDDLRAYQKFQATSKAPQCRRKRWQTPVKEPDFLKPGSSTCASFPRLTTARSSKSSSQTST